MLSIHAVVLLLTLQSAAPPEHLHGHQLDRGAAFARSIEPGDVHVYVAELDVGTLVRVDVDQRGLDVVLTVFDAAGAPRVVADSPYGRAVPEVVGVIAERAGVYRFEVRPYPSVASAGEYRFRVDAWRPATVDDRRRVAAEHRTYAAHRRAALRTAEDLRAAAVLYAEAIHPTPQVD
ncbi:MAG: hypothetical protein AAFY88_15930, partial [Acidobacteriota bacterium]